MVAAVRSWLRADAGRAYLLLGLALAAAIYAPTLSRGLTNYDDGWLYRDNYLLHGVTRAHLAAVFTDLGLVHRFTLGAEYLPVRDLSVMLDDALFGDWYPAYHATQLVLYLAAVAVWFAALSQLGIERRVAGLAALLWAVHPSHAESVAWLAERKGVLAALLAGVAALGYARFRSGRTAGWLVLAAIAAVAAVWSKAPALFALAALAPLELVLPGRASRARSLVGLAVIGAVAAAAFVPVWWVAREATVVGSRDGSASLVLGVHGFYVRLAAMLPRDAIAYPIQTDGPSGLDLVLGALGLAAAIAGIVLARRAPAVRAGCILWLVGWLPVSHLVAPLQNVVADRYLLWPSLGFALVLAAAISRVRSVAAARALLAVIVVAACMRAFEAQAGWSSSQAMWRRAVESAPADADAWSQLANTMQEDGDLPGALAATAEGLERVPDAPRLVLRRSLLLRALGDPAGADALTRRAAELGDPLAMSNLALLEDTAHHAEEALAWARRGAALMPLHGSSQRTLGKVALDAGRPAEALPAFERAYAIDPGCTNRYNLALALRALGRAEEARPHLEACAGDPVVGGIARQLLAQP